MPPTGITAADHLTVIQLTDSHLFADPNARLLGLDTHASLQAVVDKVLAEQPRVDLVLATGRLRVALRSLGRQRGADRAGSCRGAGQDRAALAA